MASSATPSRRTSARTPRSVFGDLRTGRKLVACSALAVVPLVVRSVMARADVASLIHTQDRVGQTSKVRRGLDTVLAALTDAETRRCGVLVPGRDDHRTPLVAAQKTVAEDVDPVATVSADDLVHQQRVAQLHPRVRQESTDTQATVGVRPRLLGDRQADSASATQRARTTPIVTDLAELLSMVGAATDIVRSITGPLRRAVRVLQGPAEARSDRHLRLITRDDVRAEDPATRAGVVPAELGNVVTMITGIVRRTDLTAVDAMNGGARVGEAVTGAIAGSSQIVARISERPTPVVVSLAGARGIREAGASGARTADLQTIPAASTLTASPVRATVYAAARSRAQGPTTALWHAVELHRPVGAVDGACELTVCGSLVRVSAGQGWPVAARDVCPACATLAH